MKLKIESGDIVVRYVYPQEDSKKGPFRGSSDFLEVVSARIFSHGTNRINADLLIKRPHARTIDRVPMTEAGNDMYEAQIQTEGPGKYEISIEAWYDDIQTWLDQIQKWEQAGESIEEDIKSGIRLLNATLRRSKDADRKLISETIRTIEGGAKDWEKKLKSNLPLIRKYQIKRGRTRTSTMIKENLPKYAYFASWYEMFPRSQTNDPMKSGTFKECERRIEDITKMGFDVIYLPPIHPIGITNRRGKNGRISASPADPGSPWAIGGADGGHKSVNRDLGTLEDFSHFVQTARGRGVEVAIDLAFQCSPDHPYVKEHPEWFYHRPDGSIRYAENPPKTYYDIYPINFDTEKREELWQELKSIVDFWADFGIRIFRVDNPHTKPFSFWKWLLEEVRRKYPEVIFLSEAFTKPDVMYELSRLGFHQSYTYFTWRNFDWEIRDYFTELNEPAVSSFFRPMLFTNTPDILPYILQTGGRPAFVLRTILAGTLSPLWGVYSGFELCENEGIPGREEYLNSEKFEIKPRDWNAKGNIKSVISRLNGIRKEYAHFQRHGNLKFLNSNNPNVLAYYREIPLERSIMVVVNINPYETHEAEVSLPPDWFQGDGGSSFPVRDLLNGDRFTWKAGNNYVRLVPQYKPAHILVREK